VSVDPDFSRTAEVYDLVKQTLKIQKLETDTDYKVQEGYSNCYH
jgi:hypothetical protein